MQEDFYDILGVSRDATQEDIEEVYRKLIAKYHPDRFQGMGEEVLTLAREKTAKINEAYETLGNPKKRREYDEFLRSQGTAQGTQYNTEQSAYEGYYEAGKDTDEASEDFGIRDKANWFSALKLSFSFARSNLFSMIGDLLDRFIKILLKTIWITSRVITRPIYYGLRAIIFLKSAAGIVGFLLGIVLFSIFTGIYIAVLFIGYPWVVFVMLVIILFQCLKLPTNHYITFIDAIDLLVEKQLHNKPRLFDKIKVKFILDLFTTGFFSLFLSFFMLIIFIFVNRYLIFFGKIPGNTVAFNFLPVGAANPFDIARRVSLPDSFPSRYFMALSAAFQSLFVDKLYVLKDKQIFEQTVLYSFLTVLIFYVINLLSILRKHLNFKRIISAFILIVISFTVATSFVSFYKFKNPTSSIPNSFVGAFRAKQSDYSYFLLLNNGMLFSNAILSDALPSPLTPYLVRNKNKKQYVMAPFPLNFIKVGEIGFSKSPVPQIKFKTIVAFYGSSNYNANKIPEDQLVQKFVFHPNTSYVYINGKRIYTGSPNIIKNGIFYIYPKEIVNKLGGNFQYSIIKKATIIKTGSKTIEIKVGSNKAKVNNSYVSIYPGNNSVKTFIYNNKLYIPIRFIADSLNCKIEWNSKARALIMWYPK